MKGLGLTARKADGSRLKIDDPELDPIWETAARLRIPVFMHTADPAGSSNRSPMRMNAGWRWRALSQPAVLRPVGVPALRGAHGRTRSARGENPKTTFVLAHLGWHAQDLGRLGAMMDRMPNVHAELGAVLYDIGRQPRMAHAFFVKYQDWLLSAKAQLFNLTSIRTTGGRSRPPTSTSTTTAITTHSGNCTAWPFPTVCSERCTTRMR